MQKAPERKSGITVIVFEIHGDDITHPLVTKTRETDDEKFLDAAVRTERSSQQRICHSHTYTHTNPLVGALCVSLIYTHTHTQNRPTL